jgi:hypothetical protein
MARQKEGSISMTTDTDRAAAVASLVRTAGVYQAPLIYTPVLTCLHCKGTTFAIRDGQFGRRYRCTSCDRRADTAMCSCSHHYGAHAAGGCMGVQDDGFLCECNLRGSR